ncbi:MAG: tail fiber domain-containing protein, partial [bacterium]|nr:tail fiber domain-containing protein [bacterium]
TTWKLQLNSDDSMDMASGASCTAASDWTDASSIELKENIRNVTAKEAFDTLSNLKPVRYNYKVDKEDEYVGFIAEEVPELVAQKNRKSMSSMDVVAVLTKVLQQQQETIKEIKAQHKKTIADLEKRIAQLEKK